MAFFEVFQDIGFCFGAYLCILFFPWIFAIFANNKFDSIEELSLVKKQNKKQKKYSYHIDLSTEIIINFKELDQELIKELEKRKISASGSKSTLVEKIELVDEMIDIRNIRELYKSKKYSEVINSTKKRIDIYPEDIESRIFLLRSYFLTKEYKNCIEIAERILKLEENNINAIRFIARSNSKLGKEEESILNYLEILKTSPNDLDALSSITRTYYNLDDYDNSIKIAKKVLEIEENNIDAMRFIARSYKNLVNLEMSSKYYLQIIEKVPKDLDSCLMLIRIYYTTENYKKCIKIAEKTLNLEENNIDAMRFIARSYKSLNNDKKMKKKYLELIAKYPNDFDSLSVLSRTYYNDEEYKNCIEIAERILKLEENNINAMRFIARSNSKLGKEEESILNYLVMSEKYPNDIETLSTLIKHYYNHNDSDKVLIYCGKILEIDEENKLGLLFKARVLRKLEKLEESIIYWKKILKNDNNDTEALIELGRTLHNLGEYSKSLAYLEKGLENSPGDRRAIRTLALVYDRMKEEEKALNLYILECENYPRLVSNWEKRINLLYRMNKEQKAKDTLKEIFRLLGDTLEANLIALSVAKSWYWKEESTEIMTNSNKRWGDNVDFHISIAENALGEGDLTRAYSYLSNAKKIKINSRVSKLEEQLLEMLDSTSTSIGLLEQTLEKDETLLFIECIIKAISNQAKNNTIRKSNKEFLDVSIVSSSLGRGGAERQVVACLNGLKDRKEINKLDLYCYKTDNTAGASDTYENEIRELGININEFGDQRNWNKLFVDEMKSLEPWRKYLDLLPKRFLREIEPLYLYFKQNKPDIVHAWQDQTNINAGLAALMAGVPGIVLFARSQRPDGKTMMHMRNRPYLKRAYDALLEHSNIVLCHNSMAGAQSYREWIAPPENIEFPVIYNGTDFNGIAKENDDLFEEHFSELKLPENAKIIGTVFRFVKEKQPLLWVNTIAKVCEKDPNVFAVMIGSGILSRTTQEYINNLGLQNRIFLPGQTRMVKSWLDKFDIFFLCSRVEGLPNVIIEAQGFGVPVISTKAGGASETIIEGITGHIVDSHNPEILSQKINTILNDKKWLENASEKAIEFSQRTFSLPSMINRLLEIYRMPLD